MLNELNNNEVEKIITAEEAELEKVKGEILQAIQADKEKKKIAWGSGAVSVVLIVLALISMLQVFQSVSILNKINSGAIQSASAATGAASSTGEVPDMVGGC